MVQLSYPYMTTGKIIVLTIWTFVGKVMSLLFNMLSSFVIAFPLRSKCLFISWLQSPSAVFKEWQGFKKIQGRSQDGGGVGRGEHFLPHKFIKKAFKGRVNPTKQLLNAGRGHQAPRKAAQLFERR